MTSIIRVHPRTARVAVALLVAITSLSIAAAA